ncbi:hypothetical protein KC331_g4944 [Hortaea werneckii]|nr:hypothetical protein KC331_g4944 [Hortaea werneckii]
MWQRRRNDPTLQDLLAEDEASWEKEDDRNPWGKGPPRAARSDEDFHSRIVRPEDDEAAENVLWQRFESIENQTAMDDEKAAASVPLTYADTAASSSSSSEAPLDYLNVLPIAIAHESHHLIARCLRTALHHHDFAWIRSLPEPTFTQILTLLSPSRTLGRHIETHTSISPALTTRLHITPLHEIASEYSELLGNLVQIRWSQSTDHSSVVPVTLPQYNLLLRSAATLGNRSLALRIWKRMTTQTDHQSFQDAVVPDVESYNALMSAVTFNRQLNAPTRYRNRVIPFHMHARNPEVVREVDRGAGFKGYSVSPSASSGGRAGGGGVGLEGVKGRILRMLQGLLGQGVKANEETWRVVILAAAREGDLGTVEKVIARVWGVEVGRIGKEEEGEEENPAKEGGNGGNTAASKKKTPKGGNAEGKESNPDNFIPYPSTSPLHPTPALLTALAHAYGINNALPTALKLVDHFSRSYSVSIPHATWSELLEWTFVLSVPRTGKKAQFDGTKTGQLPLSAVGNLWGVMTARNMTTTTRTEGEVGGGESEGMGEGGKGYNVQPDMRMYDYLVKNLILREMGPEVLRRMEEGRTLYTHSRDAAQEAWKTLLEEGRTERKRARRHRPKQREKQEKKKEDEEKEPLPPTSNNTHPLPSSAETPPNPPPSLPPELLYPSYPTYAHRTLVRNRHILYLRRWVRLLLRTTRSIHYPDSLHHTATFSLRTLPRFLAEWRAFAPRTVKFEIPGGMVEFAIRSQREVDRDVGGRWAEGVRRASVLKRIGVVRGGTLEEEKTDERGWEGDGEWGPDLFGTQAPERRLPERFWSEGHGARRAELVRKVSVGDESVSDDEREGQVEEGGEDNEFGDDKVGDKEEVEEEVKEALKRRER